MSLLGTPADWTPAPGTYFKKVIARPSVQDWVSRVPGLRWFAKRDGAQIFELVQGFVRSQVLYAIVQLNLPERLLDGPLSAEVLADTLDFDLDRMEILLKAGVAIGVLQKRFGRFGLTRQGAALVGVPGLQDMILHHTALYRDMTDPVALLKGETQTELANFWPYVFGATGASDPATAKRYSDLMADTQALLARDTLQTVDMRRFKRILDVGGGTGAFAIALAQNNPAVKIDLVDLPAVEPAAIERIDSAGLRDRIAYHGRSFRDDPLPRGADAITLIRVLYDHNTATVRALLKKVHDLLPPGGTLVISEPMSGGDTPDTITDVYFAFYTLAMRTGRTRSAPEIASLCREAGFETVTPHRPMRSYVTSVVTAVKPR